MAPIDKKPAMKEVDAVFLGGPFPQAGKITLYLCPKCDEYGFQSIYGPTCTACANAERFKAKPLPQAPRETLMQRIRKWLTVP